MGGICLNVKVLVKQPEAEHIFVNILFVKGLLFFVDWTCLFERCVEFLMFTTVQRALRCRTRGNNGSGRLTHFGAHCRVSKMHRRVFAGKKHHFDIRIVFSSVQM